MVELNYGWLFRYFCLFIGLFIMGSLQRVNAQVHFIYVQSEQKLQFNLEVGGQKARSNPNGYAIIGGVPEGKQVLKISSPIASFSVQEIPVEINSDAGFALKDFGENGWGLFDLQSLKIFMNSAAAQSDTKIVDAGSTMDSLQKQQEPSMESTRQGVIDSARLVALQETNNALSEMIRKDSSASMAIKTDSVEATSGEDAAPASVQDHDQKQGVDTAVVTTQIVQARSKPDSIVLIHETKDVDGVAFVYEVKDSAVKDTVQIFIPGAINANGQDKKEVNPKVEALQTDTVQEQPKEEKKLNTGGEKETAANEEAAAPVNQKPDSYNSNASEPLCIKEATEEDFLRLRKKMVGESGTDKMLDQATKAFKDKCFSTIQVKNLGAIFLTDLDKLRFYQLAFKATSDKNNFDNLRSTLDNPASFSVIIKE